MTAAMPTWCRVCVQVLFVAGFMLFSVASWALTVLSVWWLVSLVRR
jgi:hypothetical protein